MLQAHLFGSLDEAREHIHQQLISYNEERPDESLGNIPPALFRQS
jgi:putative transposase